MKKPVILLTNDDGVRAKGLRVLYHGIKELGEVWVVAPNREKSGAGHSFTPKRSIRVQKLEPRWFGISGTPTDCVLLAHYALIRKPIDLIISGINHGPNLGEDVTYSGTVAAALEGAILKIPSLAVSVIDRNKNLEIAVRLIKELIKSPPWKGTFLNINIPSGEIKGIKVTYLGKRIYKDRAHKSVNEKGEVSYRIYGELSCEPKRGSDCEAIEKGWISITPLKVDLTDYSRIERLKGWVKRLRI